MLEAVICLDLSVIDGIWKTEEKGQGREALEQLLKDFLKIALTNGPDIEDPV